jgi:Na+/proline symporter
MAAYPWVILALVGMAIPAVAISGAKPAVPELALMALPPWLVGLLMISLLSATLSTTAILILAASHITVHDIFKRAINPKMSDSAFLMLTRAMIFICTILVIIPALRDPEILPLLYWIFSFAIPVFGVYLIGMLWKVNSVTAWITILAGYAAAFLWTFAAPPWLPEYLSLNVYPTTFATLLFGVVLNLILPGKPGYLRQLKAASQKTDAVTAAATDN